MIYNLYVEYFLIELQFIYIVHHLLVILPFPITFYFNQGSKYLIMFIPLEFTNIFLTVFNILKSFDKQDSIIFKINMVLFWFSYTLIRIIYTSIIIFKMNMDIFFCTDSNNCPKINSIIKITYIISTSLLFLMTIIWYNKISRGLFKKIKPRLKNIFKNKYLLKKNFI